MKRPYFFGDQFVGHTDLDAIESSLASQLILRSQLPASSSLPGPYTIFRGGVFGSPLNMALDQDLKVLRLSSGSLSLASGKALESDGQLINVPASITLSTGSMGVNYSWASTADGAYYVKLAYQESSGSFKHNSAGIEFATRYIEGYYVTVDLVAPTVNQICLATVAVSSANIASIGDTRSYVGLIMPANGVILDPITNRVTSVVSAQDHVMGLGGGVVTEPNPHGLLPGDIGAAAIAESSAFGSPTISNVLLNKVYRNDNGSTIYFEANIQTFTQDSGGSGQNAIQNAYSVYASSSGSITGSTGSLAGTVHELGRFASKLWPAYGINMIMFREPVRGFIPTDWYYKVAITEGLPNSTGSVMFFTINV